MLSIKPNISSTPTQVVKRQLRTNAAFSVKDNLHAPQAGYTITSRTAPAEVAPTRAARAARAGAGGSAAKSRIAYTQVVFATPSEESFKAREEAKQQSSKDETETVVYSEIDTIATRKMAGKRYYQNVAAGQRLYENLAFGGGPPPLPP